MAVNKKWIVAPIVLAILAGGVQPAFAASAVPVSAASQSDDAPGVDPWLRQIVADNAEFAEDVEVRDAAAAALADGSDAAIMEFLDHGLADAQARAEARKQAVDQQNRAAIQAMAGTGGPYFNAEVVRVLAGTPSDRAAFLDYGADLARKRDADDAKAAADLAKNNRALATFYVARGGAEVQRTGQIALNTGDAAIAEWLKTGYAAAQKIDQGKH